MIRVKNERTIEWGLAVSNIDEQTHGEVGRARMIRLKMEKS